MESAGRRPKPGRDGERGHKQNGTMAEFAEKALAAFRRDLKSEYAELVEAFDGSAAAVGVFGVGSVTIAVRDGKVEIDPPAERCPPLIGRGATYPEVIGALARGEVTALDAFHRGDLLVQTQTSDELRRAYDFFVRFSGSALESKRLHEVLREFEAQVG
jgi:hypothetical protein